MSERGMFPANVSSSPAEVMVAIWNDESIGESVKLAQELRESGLRVDLYPEADKLGKQFKYASSRDVHFVVVIGDDERARGEVSVKDLKTGVQKTVKRADILAAVRG